MAVNGYFLGGLGLWGLLIGKQLMALRKQSGGLRLERGVELLLTSQGATAGVRVIYLCLTVKNLKPFSTDDRVYVLIGGVALIWVSLTSIAQEFKRVRTSSSVVVPEAIPAPADAEG